MTQSNLSSSKEFTAGQPKQASSVLRVALIILIAAFVVEAFYLFLAWQMGAWQMSVLAGVIAAFCVANLVAIRIIQSGKLETGSWIIVIGMLGVFPAAGALIANVGWVSGGALVLLTWLVASQSLAAKPARQAVIASILLGVLTGALDLLGLNYRLLVPQIQVFIPVITAVILLMVLVFAIRQSSTAFSNSLQGKVTVWTGSLLAGVAIILIAYSTFTARQLAIDNAQKELLALASSQARQIRADVEIPLDTARALAQALTAIKDPASNLSLSRDQVNAMLRQVLVENPSFLGTYTLWEPDAFDGRDATFRNQTAHDETGRFIPYWVRGKNSSVDLIALADYETPGVGDWYILPRQTKKEVTIAPLIYPINGVDTVMASFVVPIIYNNQFYGIAGVDAPISFVQNIVDNMDVYSDTAQAILMTSNGTLIGVSNKPELANQPASSLFTDFSDLQARVAAGDAFSSFSADGQYLRVFAPVDLGKTGTHWAFVLIIPFAAITSAATSSALLQGAIGFALILLALAVLWLLARQLVRPLLSLTAVAAAISQGNLNVKADVQSADETGVLAQVINQMISQLQSLVTTLEDRVAERTRGLELAVEVGRSVSQVRALDVMLTDAVEIIRAQFELYYTQIYLTSPNQTELILQAGTGSVGAELLGRDHRLALNTGSINGRAAIDKRPVVIADTSVSASFRPNPLLPETRSEMAVPLMIGEKVVGVLDMQSRKAGALSQESLPAFEALAGQLAIAIQNANFLAETNQARSEVEAQARRLTRAGWQDYQDAVHQSEQTGFVFENNAILPFEQNKESQPVEDANALSAAISVTGEQIGTLTVAMNVEDQTTQTVELVNIVARQVAQQVENLRLLESANRYRAEAEEASSRLTRTGWQDYLQTKPGEALRYMYDLKSVRQPNAEIDRLAETPAYSLPLKVREETIGNLSVQGLESSDGESIALATAVAERLGAHIESLRQFDQAQSALVQSEKLFEASRRLTLASDLQDLVKATVETLNIPAVNRAILGAFSYNAAGELESMTDIANWWSGTGSEVAAVGTTYSARALELLSVFLSDKPLFFNDTFHDERMGAGGMQIAKGLNIRAGAVLPLLLGTRQLGILMLQAEEPHSFSQNEIRLFSALAPQIATVLENRRQFERAQKQAERETTLNIISQKIQSATSVEAVLQIAARELGHALGAPRTIAQLSIKDRK